MLLLLETTRAPATDLGYLLHKHPDKMQEFDLSFGKARVFYPEASDERCQAALLVEADAVELARSFRGGPKDADAAGSLGQYVNDRPYAGSSLLSVAIAKVFRSALSGECKDRPEAAAAPMPLRATLPVVPCRGGDAALRKLFEPLGYAVSAARLPLDEQFPEWGESRYWRVELSGEVRLADLLCHLYVLLPVLDDAKHYWVDRAEVDKLLRRGEAWLPTHPEREMIVDRYLRRRRALTRLALARLLDDEEESADPDEAAAARDQAEEAIEKPIGLHKRRLQAVAELMRDAGAKRVLDLGCGEGKLVELLMKEKQFEEIVAMDVSVRSLEIAARRLKTDRMPPSQAKRLTLAHGSLLYRDKRLEGYDAAAAVEVIEHLDPARLVAFERVVFTCARPALVVVTTPNVEYNVRFPTLAAGSFRHGDHRFEWTRAEFESWGRRVAEANGYSVRFEPLGDVDPEVGAPSQMGVFAR